MNSDKPTLDYPGIIINLDDKSIFVADNLKTGTVIKLCEKAPTKKGFIFSDKPL